MRRTTLPLVVGFIVCVFVVGTAVFPAIQAEYQEMPTDEGSETPVCGLGCGDTAYYQPATLLLLALASVAVFVVGMTTETQCQQDDDTQ